MDHEGSQDVHSTRIVPREVLPLHYFKTPQKKNYKSGARQLAPTPITVSPTEGPGSSSHRVHFVVADGFFFKSTMASRGQELYDKAEAKLKSISLFSNKWEDAQEIFNSSGAQFKVEKNWDMAGKAFMRSGDCAVKLKNPADACQAYTESAGCYKKVDASKAGAAIAVAVQLNIDNNRLGAAAKLEKEFGEALEGEGKVKEAIEHFQKAHDYFFAEDQPVSAQGCIQKIARLQADQNNFVEAVKLYEKLGNAALTGPLKHQAREYFFKAFLCRLAQIVNDNREEMSGIAREALEGYTITDNNFRGTRELEFCEHVLDAVESANVEDFDDAVQSLNEMRMLDEFKTHVLVIVRRNIEDDR